MKISLCSKVHRGPGSTNRLLDYFSQTGSKDHPASLGVTWSAHRFPQQLLAFKTRITAKISSYPKYSRCWIVCVPPSRRSNPGPLPGGSNFASAVIAANELKYEGMLKSFCLAYNRRETRDKRPSGRNPDRSWCPWAATKKALH